MEVLINMSILSLPLSVISQFKKRYHWRVTSKLKGQGEEEMRDRTQHKQGESCPVFYTLESVFYRICRSCLRTVICLLPSMETGKPLPWNSHLQRRGPVVIISCPSISSPTTQMEIFIKSGDVTLQWHNFFSCKVTAHIIGVKILIKAYFLASRGSQALLWGEEI